MSNERIVKTAEAVEDLRKALELWCMRDENAGSTLGVRASANAAVAAVDTALFELQQIRRDTIAQTHSYDNATMARVDALLATPRPIPPGSDWSTTYYCLGCGVVVVGHERCGDPTRPECSATADYRCADCGKLFPVDPCDPIESHGAYLDHQAEHDDDDEVSLGPVTLAQLEAEL